MGNPRLWSELCRNTYCSGVAVAHPYFFRGCSLSQTQLDSVATVAHAKPPVRKYSCAELGVCHCNAPGFCDCDVDPENPDGIYRFDMTAARVSIALASMATIFVACGIAGYLSSVPGD